MKPVSLLALGLATGLLGAGGASAADLGLPYQPAPSVLQEYGSGWYLRGDIGWTSYNAISADYAVASLAAVRDDSAKLEDAWSIGGGFGFKSDWFRVDVTSDYRPNAKFTGVMDQLFGEVTTWSTLLNGYFDLGTWSGITPYVGAGIGGAYHDTRKWHDILGNQVFADGSNWELAWAVMAGMAIHLGPKTSIDLGYRYIDLGKAESGNDLYYNLVKAKTDDLSAHEIRVGVRYTLD